MQTRLSLRFPGRSRFWFPLLAIALVLNACTVNRLYHGSPPSRQLPKNPLEEPLFFPPAYTNNPDAWLTTLNSNAHLGVIEFDDQGAFLDRRQSDDCAAFLRSLKAGPHPEPVTLIIYTHGWRHNAREDSSNFMDFKRYVDLLGRYCQSPPEGMHSNRVVGIYIGWRGALIEEGPLTAALAALTTLPNRKSTATLVSRISYSEAMLSLCLAAKERDQADQRSKVVVIGHSLGGLITERGFTPAMLGKLLSSSDADTHLHQMNEALKESLKVSNEAGEEIRAHIRVLTNELAGVVGSQETNALNDQELKEKLDEITQNLKRLQGTLKAEPPQPKPLGKRLEALVKHMSKHLENNILSGGGLTSDDRAKLSADAVADLAPLPVPELPWFMEGNDVEAWRKRLDESFTDKKSRLDRLQSSTTNTVIRKMCETRLAELTTWRDEAIKTDAAGVPCLLAAADDYVGALKATEQHQGDAAVLEGLRREIATLNGKIGDCATRQVELAGQVARLKETKEHLSVAISSTETLIKTYERELKTFNSNLLRPPADLVVMVNPAEEAVLAQEFISAFKHNSLLTNYNEKRPWIVSMTSTGDWATHYLFPIAQTVLRPSKNLRSEPIDRAVSVLSEAGAWRTAVSFDTNLQSHILRPVPELVEKWTNSGSHNFRSLLQANYHHSQTNRLIWLDRDVLDLDRLSGSSNNTPYWVFTIGTEIVPDHSRIFTDNFAALLAGLLRITADNFSVPGSTTATPLANRP